MEKYYRKYIEYRINNIGECGSTIYVGLIGIVWNLIQKSTGIGPPF